MPDIPTEAVEAAARAMYGDDWADAHPDARTFYTEVAKRALAAALPHLIEAEAV